MPVDGVRIALVILLISLDQAVHKTTFGHSPLFLHLQTLFVQVDKLCIVRHRQMENHKGIYVF